MKIVLQIDFEKSQIIKSMCWKNTRDIDDNYNIPTGEVPYEKTKETEVSEEKKTSETNILEKRRERKLLKLKNLKARVETGMIFLLVEFVLYEDYLKITSSTTRPKNQGIFQERQVLRALEGKVKHRQEVPDIT